MNLNLEAGFQSNVNIKDKDGKILFEKNYSSADEVKAFINQYGKSKLGWS